MLLFPPPQFRRRRGRTNENPTAPAPAAITVVSVDWNGTNDLVWNFSDAVTLTGANVPQLESDLDGTGMWQSPTGCAQGSATSIVATYPDPMGEGTPWRIAATPSNIAEAAQVTVPQSGSVA